MFTQENSDECFANKRKPSYTDTNRFVFYQAGRCLVQTLLLNHPKISLLKVTESRNNVVSSIQGLPPIETRTNLETLLIGFYAGRAGELFTGYIQTDSNQHPPSLKNEYKAAIMRPRRAKTKLCVRCKTEGYATQGVTGNKTEGFVSLSCKNKAFASKQTRQLSDAKVEQFLCQSDTGLFERVKATFLIQSLTVNGSIYSQNFFNLQKSSIVGNLNNTEIKDKKISYFFQSLEEHLKNVYLQGNTVGTPFRQKSFNKGLTNFSKKEPVTKPKLVTEPLSTGALQANNLLESKKIDFISQKKEISSCCEEIVCKTLTFSMKPYGYWFRIYLPQIEAHQRQPFSSDQFFKKRRELGFDVRELRSVGKESSNETKFCSANKVKKRDTKICNTNKAKLCQKVCLSNKRNILVIASLPCSVECCCVKTELLPERSSGNLLQKPSFCNRLKDNMFTPISAGLLPEKVGYRICHNLVLNTFSQAFNLLGKNRELLDMLTDHLIRFGKIRAPEILRICSFYVDTANTFVISADQNYSTLPTRTRR